MATRIGGTLSNRKYQTNDKLKQVLDILFSFSETHKVQRLDPILLNRFQRFGKVEFRQNNNLVTTIRRPMTEEQGIYVRLR